MDNLKMDFSGQEPPPLPQQSGGVRQEDSESKSSQLSTAPVLREWLTVPEKTRTM